MAEIVRQLGAFAFPQDHRTIAVKRKSLLRIGKRQLLRRRIRSLLCSGSPHLGGQHVSRNHLVSNLRIQICLYQRLLREGFLFCSF